MIGKRYKYVCSHCGSDDVTSDALAQWDEAKQEWALIDTLDNTDCNQCEGPANLKTVIINDTSKPCN